MNALVFSPTVEAFLVQAGSTRQGPDGGLVRGYGDGHVEVARRDGAWVVHSVDRGVRQAPDLITDSAEAAGVYFVVITGGAWRTQVGLPMGPTVAGMGPVEGFVVEGHAGAFTLRWSDAEGEHYARVRRERNAWRLAWAMRLGVEALVAGYRDPAGGGLLDLS